MKKNKSNNLIVTDITKAKENLGKLMEKISESL